MKYFLTALSIFGYCALFGQSSADTSTRTILLDQLKATQEVQDWFVPIANAIKGLTAEQASWRANDSCHSIAQETNHLIFWNLRALYRLKDETAPAYNGNNDETFRQIKADEWKAIQQRMDSVSEALETEILAERPKALEKNYVLIAHISTHNAYHTGQIMYIRKEEKAWDSTKGVK